MNNSIENISEEDLACISAMLLFKYLGTNFNSEIIFQEKISTKSKKQKLTNRFTSWPIRIKNGK